MNKEKKGNYYYLKIKNIGYLEYQINYETIEIINIFIKENQRNKKYASMLLSEIEKLDKKRIILEVKVDNTPALNLYKKFNYKIINKRDKYYKDGKDAYVMEKIL